MQYPTEIKLKLNLLCDFKETEKLLPRLALLHFISIEQ